MTSLRNSKDLRSSGRQASNRSLISKLSKKTDKIAGPKIMDSYSLSFVILCQEVESDTCLPVRFQLDSMRIIGDNMKL
jgi:hypothetical protein